MSSPTLTAGVRGQGRTGLWSRVSQRHILVGGLAGVLCVLVGLPLLVLFISSLKSAQALPFDSSPLTLENYAEIYLDGTTYRLLGGTFLYAASSLVIGLSIAFAIAWLVERTDMPGSNLIYTGMFIPLAVPGMITALGWVLLLNPNNGVLNLALRALFDLSGRGPLSIYTLGGMAFVTGLAVVPTMFVMLAALMRNMDPSLEEAGQMSGAPLGGVFRRITAPLLLPGSLAVAVYFSIILIEYFEIPLVIGLTAGARVLSTQIYLTTRGEGFLPDHGLAAAYALIGLVLGVALTRLYMWVTRHSERFAVLTGKGFRPRRVPLGKWRYPALGFVTLYLLLELGLPLAILLWSSLHRFYQPPSLEALAAINLGRYESVFLRDTRLLGIVSNTLLLVVGAASLCMLLAALVAWVVVRSRGTAARWLDLVAFLPAAMPSILLALALYLLSIGTPLQGTVAVIMLGHILRYLPFATRTMHSGFLQIHKELEEAGMTSGASAIGVFRRIVAPLVTPSLLNGWLWVVAASMRDITFPLMLVSAGNTVVGMLLWEYWSQGQIPEASAVAISLVIVLILLVFPLRLRSTAIGTDRA
jgi:iron(III) transport system permease protein